MTADQIARDAEFFCFGTNDLTQMTFGFSRDDCRNVSCRDYLRTEILPKDPFQSLDHDGVGQLMRIGDRETAARREHRPQVRHLRRTRRRPAIDRHSVHELGLNYVQCSPFRVPIARLAAAQAAIEASHSKKEFKDV